MAFALLTAQARQLLSAGLHYILTPEECPYSPAVISSARRQTAAPSARKPCQQPAGQRPGAPDQHSWRKRERSSKAPSASPARQAPSRTMPAPQAARQPAPTRSADIPAPRAAVQWPEEWQKLYARTKPGRIVWTYYGLGHDLCGRANRNRSAILRQLIAYLRYPAGTHTFWPVGLPARDADEESRSRIEEKPELFWAGVERLGARIVIVMGSPAAKLIGMEEYKLFWIKRVGNCAVLPLPDIDSLTTTSLPGIQDGLQEALSRLLPTPQFRRP